ncbi:hypothetical protein [Hutsoniella sourekii]|uniref:hypothetical protein n=1 Tax=Hutsoniella sourekii TaxID=87650 RepID=UPI0004B6CA27|nr:hypothetical protein [Hutsoniella sourekii]
MMVAKFYFSDKCPDTPEFQKALNSFGIDYQAVNITDSMANLKEFLSLRDQREEFDSAKELGRVGIPVLLTSSDLLLFDTTDLERL